MAIADKILKNFALFVDGKGYAGNAEELQLPNLTLKGEDFRGGGMDGTVFIEMGQEKMETKFTLSSYDADALSLWGAGPSGAFPLVARGALESNTDGAVEPVVVNMTATVRSIEPGAWKPGEKSTVVFTCDVSAYKYTQNGVVIHDIDIPNMVRMINGTDALLTKRNALGL